LKMFYDHLI